MITPLPFLSSIITTFEILDIINAIKSSAGSDDPFCSRKNHYFQTKDACDLQSLNHTYNYVGVVMWVGVVRSTYPLYMKILYLALARIGCFTSQMISLSSHFNLII